MTLHKQGEEKTIPPLGSPWVWGVPLFGLLALALISATGTNQSLFQAINHLPLPDAVWAGLTILGDPVVALSLMLPFCGRRPDLIRALVVTAPIATLTLHGMKTLIGAPRPLAVLGSNVVHVIGPALTRGSFPSGHTTTIFTLAALLCLLNARRGYMIALIGFAALVGLSRCGVGAHWPADIAAGAVNGWMAAVLGVYLAGRWPGGLGLTAQRGFAVILLLCTVSLLGFYDSRYPQAAMLQYLIALISLALATPSLLRLFRRQ